MIGTAMADQRHRLAELLDSGAVEQRLARWADERRVDASGGWQREYGRLRPGQSSWAVLAYAATPSRATVRVDVAAPAPNAKEPHVVVRHCREDPALPGLPVVLDALAAVVVRYRPGNRCTVLGELDGLERYVKITAGEPDRQHDAQQLWAASVVGRLGVAVAEPLGFDELTRSSSYGVVPGGPVAPVLLGPDGESMARAIGAALGRLAQAPLQPSTTATPDDQVARTRRAVRRAVAAAPALAEDLERVVAEIERWSSTWAPRPLVPVHGAPHMHQWLHVPDGRGRPGGDSGLGLVDLDRFALGEPELDIATFLVELASESDRALSIERLEDAVTSGFAATAWPLDRARLAAYSVHKRLAKVTRTATGIRPDGAERAARHLAAVLDELPELRRTVRSSTGRRARWISTTSPTSSTAGTSTTSCRVVRRW